MVLCEACHCAQHLSREDLAEGFRQHIEAEQTLVCQRAENGLAMVLCGFPVGAQEAADRSVDDAHRLVNVESSMYSVSLQYNDLATTRSAARTRRTLSSMTANTDPAPKPLVAKTRKE